MTPAGDEIAEYPQPEAPVRDGIGEEDNPIPLWFNVSFYGTIAFGIVYVIYYLFSGWSAASQYAAEVTVAEAKYAAVRAEMPKTNPYRNDPAAIAQGKETFDTVCAVCHKPDGSGLVGPSLVDPYWKYGHDDESLYTSVAGGRPLGMPAWETQLGADKIWKALAYLETLPTSDQPGVGSPELAAPN